MSWPKYINQLSQAASHGVHDAPQCSAGGWLTGDTPSATNNGMHADIMQSVHLHSVTHPHRLQGHWKGCHIAVLPTVTSYQYLASLAM